MMNTILGVIDNQNISSSLFQCTNVILDIQINYLRDLQWWDIFRRTTLKLASPWVPPKWGIWYFSIGFCIIGNYCGKKKKKCHWHILFSTIIFTDEHHDFDFMILEVKT